VLCTFAESSKCNPNWETSYDPAAIVAEQAPVVMASVDENSFPLGSSLNAAVLKKLLGDMKTKKTSLEEELGTERSMREKAERERAFLTSPPPTREVLCGEGEDYKCRFNWQGGKFRECQVALTARSGIDCVVNGPGAVDIWSKRAPMSIP